MRSDHPNADIENALSKLGLNIESANEASIKKAYYKLALKAHPDKGGTEEAFKELGNAFALLSEPEALDRLAKMQQAAQAQKSTNASHAADEPHNRPASATTHIPPRSTTSPSATDPIHHPASPTSGSRVPSPTAFSGGYASADRFQKPKAAPTAQIKNPDAQLRILLSELADPKNIDKYKNPQVQESLKTRLGTLLDSGANVNIVEPNRQLTALHAAAYFGFNDLTTRILAKGVEVDRTTTHGHTALHLAAFNGQTTTATTLIANKANAFMNDKDGNLPLHLAAVNGHIETVNALVKGGGFKTTLERNNNNETPLGAALSLNQVGVVQALVAKGVNPEGFGKHSPTHDYDDPILKKARSMAADLRGVGATSPGGDPEPVHIGKMYRDAKNNNQSRF
jgi:curved DNA-binding protein CbpA